MQFEALAVAVRGADGQPIAGQEIRASGAAFGQSLSLVQLLALVATGRGHGGAGIPGWDQIRRGNRIGGGWSPPVLHQIDVKGWVRIKTTNRIVAVGQLSSSPAGI